MSSVSTLRVNAGILPTMNVGCNPVCLNGYRSQAMDVLGMNEAILNGTYLCFKL